MPSSSTPYVLCPQHVLCCAVHITCLPPPHVLFSWAPRVLEPQHARFPRTFPIVRLRVVIIPHVGWAGVQAQVRRVGYLLPLPPCRTILSLSSRSAAHTLVPLPPWAASTVPRTHCALRILGCLNTHCASLWTVSHSRLLSLRAASPNTVPLSLGAVSHSGPLLTLGCLCLGFRV